MIAISTADPRMWSSLLSDVKLPSTSIRFNPGSLAGTSCHIICGPHSNISETHCYINLINNLPIIYCYDPAELLNGSPCLFADPIRRVFIRCCLSKAKKILEVGYNPTLETITIVSPSDTPASFALPNDTLTPISIDIEVNPTTGKFLSFGYSLDNITATCIPFDVNGFSYFNLEQETQWRQYITNILASPNPKIFQNFIFDCMYLRKWDFTINGSIHDTMIMAHLINPELPKGLADLGRIYLMCPPWKNIHGHKEVWTSDNKLWHYNALDALRTRQLHQVLSENLGDAKRLYFEQQVPLATEVLDLCMRGWHLDLPGLKEMRQQLSEKATHLHQQIQISVRGLIPSADIEYVQRKASISRFKGPFYTKAGLGYAQVELPPGTKMLKSLPFPVYEKIITPRIFNPASPPQVQELITAMGLKVPIQKGTKTANEQALQRLLDDPKLPQNYSVILKQILDLRGIEKMISTYCDVLLDNDGILRFSLNMAGTVGSRFASRKTPWGTGFNAQNIPKEFRHLIIPHHPGWKIINLDFKQADPHIVGWLSREERMLAILADPKGDLHAHTGSLIAGHDITIDPSYDKDISRERRLGKTLNNGLNYGMQPKKLQAQIFASTGIKVSLDEATRLHTAYFAGYPGIKRWHDEVARQLRLTRMLKTPFGRTRFFYDTATDEYGWIKLLQNGLAYIPPTTIGDALNALWLGFAQSCKASGLKAEVLQQCHDSLMIQCPADEVDATCFALQNSAKAVTFQIHNYTCNLPIDLQVGDNWGKLMKWEKPIS